MELNTQAIGSGAEEGAFPVGGKDYFMGEPGSARRFAVKVLAAAGVPWKLPPFSWPPT